MCRHLKKIALILKNVQSLSLKVIEKTYFTQYTHSFTISYLV